MKKRGFTLVEILAVIVVLGIIVMIVLPQISGSMDTKKEKEYEKIKETVESAAKVFHSSNQDIYRINLETLVNERYLTTDLTNPIDGSKMAGCVRVFVDEDGIYNYSYAESCGTKSVPFTVDIGGGKANQIFESSYLDGTIIELKDATLKGFNFSHWEVVKGNSYIRKGKLIIGDTETILKAMWVSWPILTMNYNGGTPTQVLEEKYKSGETITLGVPTRAGYTFEGWEVTSGNGVISGSNFTMGSVDTTVKAKWTANQYTVTFDADGGAVTPETKLVTYETVYGELPTPVREGYTFDGWYIGNTEITETSIMNTIVGTTLKAKWTAATYVLTFDYAGGTESETSKEVTYGSKYGILPEPLKSGYTFDGWYIGNIKIEEDSIVSITNDTIVTAKWRVNVVYINYHVNSGTISPSTTNGTTTYNWTTTDSIVYLNGNKYSQKINYGTTKDLANYNNTQYINITRTGYTAIDDAEWICHSGCTTANKTFDHDTKYNAIDYCDVSKGDCTVVLKPNWKLVTYNITYTLNSGTAGTNKPESGTYGSVVTISNPTRTGYTFAGWTISGYSSTARHGTSSTAVTSAIASTSTKIKSQYYTNLTTTNNGTITFTANWTANTYTITLTNTSATTTGSTSATATYNGGITSITAPTRTGYKFKGWYTATSGGTKVINADGTLVASVSGYTNSSSKWIKVSATTLYSQWEINDTTKPKITSLAAKGYIGGNTITATLSDNVGLSGYYMTTSSTYSCDGKTPTSWVSIDGTSYNLSKTTTEYNTLYLWVKDLAGNTQCTSKNIYVVKASFWSSNTCTVNSSSFTDSNGYLTAQFNSSCSCSVTGTCKNGNDVGTDSDRSYINIYTYGNANSTYTIVSASTGGFRNFFYINSSGSWVDASPSNSTYTSYSNGRILFTNGYGRNGTSGTLSIVVSKIVTNSTTIYNRGFVSY